MTIQLISPETQTVLPIENLASLISDMTTELICRNNENLDLVIRQRLGPKATRAHVRHMLNQIQTILTDRSPA